MNGKEKDVKDLSYGMQGYLVTLLQYALKRAGMDVGNLDGIFGRRTAKALLRFQQEQGLCADGIVGKLTWAALYPYITGYTLHRRGPEETATVALDLPVVTQELPCSHLLIHLMLKGLTMRYPFLRVYEIGRSVMGRPIQAVSMGKGKKQIGFVGPHHASGGGIVLGMLQALEEYAAALDEGGSLDGMPAMAFFDAVTLHIVPLVNPDGVDLATGALDSMDSFYVQAQALAAHYPGIPFPDGWLANISGVDLAIQYSLGWEAARRIRFAQGFTRPGPRNYVGSEPLIAPEARAMAKWVKQMDFSMILSYDAGFTDWFTASYARQGLTLQEKTRDILPILGQSIPLSP